ncbi:MAG: 30S ribosomal protein S20, partial [Ruminococcus sp.]|nr:30S ribosomal protein S20 [Ruminococcus sp.]
MANIKSAKKRVKVNRTKAASNKARNSALKTAIKKANAAIEANAADKDELVKVA